MLTEDIKWIAFFSQTGAEIADICEKIGKWPTRIITNKRPDNLRTIDPRIIKHGYLEMKNKPVESDYLDILQYFTNPTITLHGWLRVIPSAVCHSYNIYNGHPGLITKYPELKGKDPQVRAYEGKYESIGCVIHKVDPGVDEGPIHSWTEVQANKLSLNETFRILRDISLEQWTNLLKRLYG
jgi:folate-dependent phosphoribosylglycinamide formyltransferase PurN|tara:strand:- start:1340 stop:1885 length:546 start_codon:yes stop_codon:yes gene_type:complete